jgi:hypothetical protein
MIEKILKNKVLLELFPNNFWQQKRSAILPKRKLSFLTMGVLISLALSIKYQHKFFTGVHSHWNYIEVDRDRAKWGDFEKPESMKYLGLDAFDVNGDSYRDLVAGRFFYQNPGEKMEQKWKRVDFGFNVDGMLFADVDGDEYADLIGQALPNVYWLEAMDREGNRWVPRVIGNLEPTADLVNSRGYTLGQIVPGAKPEILFSSGDGIYYFQIPDQPMVGAWSKVRIASQAADTGIGVGDLDGDGDIDIAAGYGKNGEATSVGWWENPGDGSGDWQLHPVGQTIGSVDRVAVADLNEDAKADIIVTDDRLPKSERASIFWFERVAQPEVGNWHRHTIATQYVTNSLDVSDLNRDGNIDIIAAEQLGTKKVRVWENVARATQWKESVVDTGKESYLGARAFDLDNDGDRDIVSIAWDDYDRLHLWRNDIKVAGNLPAANSHLVEQIKPEQVQANLTFQPQLRAPAIDLWYGDKQFFGQIGNPQRFVNILGNVSSPDYVAIASLTYSLNGSPPTPLSIGPDLTRLAMPGDFNLELDRTLLREGENRLEIAATDFAGNQTTKEVKVYYTAGKSWSLPYQVDFSKVKNIADAVQVVDGQWKLENGGLRTAHRYYDRIVAVGDLNWTDYELTAEVTLNSFTPSYDGAPSYNLTHFGLAARWQGHADDDNQPRTKWYPLGAASEFMLTKNLDDCGWRILHDEKNRSKMASNSLEKLFKRGKKIELGKRYKFKMRVQTLKGPETLYQVKMWPADKVEIPSWDLEGKEDKQDFQSGSALLIAHHTDVTIWKISAIPLKKSN